VLQQHQRQQPGGLRFVRQQLVHDAGEPDRLGGEVLAHERVARRRGVALVEDEVEHGEHGLQPLRQRVRRGLRDRDARQPHLALGAHEPLGYGRLRQQQRPRDLGHGQAADQPQRERHLGLERERRMAAREHQPEPLVRDHVLLLAR
jgi:hypothetical protein